MSYSEAQLNTYLKHINFPLSLHPTDPLERLRLIQAHQLARIPFESLSLHYSPHRLLSLDLQDLYDKIVTRGRGGYCMELNAFFGAILRGLGYKLINSGGRVWVKDHWTGLEHMINIVTIDGQRYLVDVGFGSGGSMQPIPLIHGTEFDQIPPVRGRLEHTALSEHGDKSQRVWLYTTRDTSAGADAPWERRKMFLDIEFFPNDYRGMNLSPMTQPQSFFVQNVLATRVVLDEKTKRPKGVVSLLGGVVSRRGGGKEEVLVECKTEGERVEALDKYFEIVLSETEKGGIRGLASELKG
ncbi:N-acetyltransferase family protein [Plectosphaerella plurivora]|uniref:N-acetyltransferase family protein n=1 Tax=Plectosphaerella plurivora TaxID=936078 RepID=A0A9P8V2W9_9PEZI|nr:N-acetyltransferase family protein [Plectosphaerella plurivora]